MRLIVLLALMALLPTGCYTVLRHPEVADAESQEVRTSSCTACHSDYDVQAMENTFHHRTPYDRDPWWDRWYYSPWWWDDYGPWYGGGGGGGGGVEPPRGTQRSQGEAPRNTRPPRTRPSEQIPPAQGGGGSSQSKDESGAKHGDAVDRPTPPSDRQDSKDSSKSSAPEQRHQGEGTKNDRPPRPRP